MTVLIRTGIGLSLAVAATSLFAQTASQTPPPDSSKESEVVKLNPFEVQESSQNGYSALNSNSITRFNTELAKLPVSADIFDQTFIDDVNAVDVEDMIQQFSAGAGISSPSPNSSANQSQPGDRSGGYITIRGLFAPSQQRDGFMPNAATDSGYTSLFNVESVEEIKGPQALLYGGGGGAGGVINIVSKQAYFDAPAAGSMKYYLDQYGTKFGQLDYQVGAANFAVRVAAIQGDQKYRRINLGGPVNGQYVELAAKLGNTVVRLNSTLEYYNRTLSEDPSLTSTGTTGGADRNGENLQYILASGQAGAANSAGAAFPSGAVDNGQLNWGNVDSYGTWLNSVTSSTRFSEAEIESTWTSWLTTQVGVGYSDQGTDKVSSGLSFYAPTAGGATDPLNNNWNVGYTPADTDGSARTKGIRFSALATNELFGGRAKSSTIIGIDSIRTDSVDNNYNYFLADSSFNPIVNAALTSNNGRTILPKIYYPIDQGPNQSYYAFFTPRSQQMTISGQGVANGNYVRMITNPVNPALIGPNNPAGVSNLGGSSYSIGHLLSHGIYGTNDTDWMGGRLETLLGFRIGSTDDRVNNQGFAPPSPPTTTKESQSNTTSFNAGVNFALTKWLRPYAEFSNSFDPPLTQAQDPYGNNPPVAHGIGEEVGVKLINSSETISGSLAAYHTSSKNEQYLITSTLMNDINPSGLNGAFGPRNQWVPTNRQSQGFEAILTAKPTPNWRMRFGASFTNGKVESTTTYAQLYNDQFNVNSAGQVTYADGVPVYVLSTATSAGAGKEVAAGTAGAVPLTVALMNTPTSPYYANPVSVTGQINAGSAPGKIMKSPLFASTQGSILTGVTGLPIAQQQINASANPNNSGYLSPPGVIPVTVSGDATTGYPEYAVNWTNVYEFPLGQGWLSGFKVGGTLSAQWKLREYYYYTSGVSVGAARALESFPNLTTFNGIFGYSHKFKRILWSSQLNITNMFNHYEILITPDAINGYNNLQNLNSTWSAQPRMYVWSNTIKF